MQKEDLESLLKNGCFELFKQNIDQKDTEFTDEQIEDILYRNSIEINNEDKKLLPKKTINDYYLSGFKFQSSTFQSVNNEEQNLEQQQNLSNYWDNLLYEDWIQMKRKEEETLGKGKRNKKQLKPTALKEDSSEQNHNSDSSFEVKSNKEEIQNSALTEGEIVKQAKVQQKVQPKYLERAHKKLLKNQESNKSVIEYFSKEIFPEANAKELNNLEFSDAFIQAQNIIHHFNEIHRIGLLSFMLTYGVYFDSAEQFWDNLCKIYNGTFSQNSTPNLSAFKSYLKEFYSILISYK
eukprot:TRINITY_DN3809_c0_g1_i1.p4 TRINITY_DN3809_c0_g1~~TRINITY_DN3809_c0_g1_i1.p4  ORF type:complete len:293 (+),score=65.61 TRINITY_DN3809_c0_g1_i1:2840-3718(+)